jgi:AraC-like DNA-binding protein
MANEIRVGTSFDLSTAGLASSSGLAMLRDLFDSKVQLRFEPDPDPDQRVDACMTVNGMPGLRYARMTSSMNVSLVRPHAMLSDLEDDVCLIINMGDHLQIEQGDLTSTAGAGDAVLLVYREPATLRLAVMDYAAVRIPLSALAPIVGDVAGEAARQIRHDTAALHLLRAYLGSLPERIADPRLRGLVTTHVYDLVALAVGASREGAHIARERTLGAARLQAIKAALQADRELSIHEIARRQDVTPRYVQKLFEEVGTTFTDFVLDLRLDAARAMLTSPRYARWAISAICFEAGFGDLSYFNRRFRRRFGQTPSDMRAGCAVQS